MKREDFNKRCYGKLDFLPTYSIKPTILFTIPQKQLVPDSNLALAGIKARPLGSKQREQKTKKSKARARK